MNFLNTNVNTINIADNTIATTEKIVIVLSLIPPNNVVIELPSTSLAAGIPNVNTIINAKIAANGIENVLYVCKKYVLTLCEELGYACSLLYVKPLTNKMPANKPKNI